MNDSTISSQGTLVAVRRQSEGPPAPVFGELASLLHHDDFVLLSDEGKCRLARIKNISILEASRNATLVHFAEDKLLIRRSLGECERRLDSSIFFRASRDCIVNLSQVRQPRLLKDGGLIFLLKDGKEIVFSRRQGVLFRATRGL
jgi:two-component system, LytTR family, response regulator